MEPQEALEGYSRSAGQYDQLIEFYFRRLLRINDVTYRSEAVDMLGLKEGDRVADIGCGTGLNFEHVLRKIGASGRLVGLDYTPAMLERAEARARSQGWSNVRLVRGDAQKASDLLQGPFDAVLSTFCMSLVPSPKTVFREVARVLRPQGRFAVCDAQQIVPKGPLGLLAPVVRPAVAFVLRKYGQSNPEADYGRPRPWKTMLTDVFDGVNFEERYWGILFIASGVRRGDEKAS
ncbi:MAG: methyltransferase domain-containing protein [Nitrospirae bacterium]|nr:methyltransferase domain-containing protein [Nitrospirota bacterium]